MKGVGEGETRREEKAWRVGVGERDERDREGEGVKDRHMGEG